MSLNFNFKTSNEEFENAYLNVIKTPTQTKIDNSIITSVNEAVEATAKAAQAINNINDPSLSKAMLDAVFILDNASKRISK
jgi:hypothetical protein